MKNRDLAIHFQVIKNRILTLIFEKNLLFLGKKTGFLTLLLRATIAGDYCGRSPVTYC